ncbi:unnamed protein product [Haemonchus placei]|uniref:Uncharacterized protein n=1 Tax=Haemonchus placei TaxID=6290 RepID=A0A3P7Y9Z8_HAEPC|nr:unnamed protein product [Haemonchus placei]
MKFLAQLCRGDWNKEGSRGLPSHLDALRNSLCYGQHQRFRSPFTIHPFIVSGVFIVNARGEIS